MVITMLKGKVAIIAVLWALNPYQDTGKEIASEVEKTLNG